MRRRLTAIFAVAVVTAGCAASDRAESPAPPTPVWQRASPKQAGIDLRAALDGADLRGITSLLVARHGKLAVERYFGGTHAGDRLPVFSITKSVTSAIVALAIADGHLTGPSERLPWRRQITLGQLLSMSAGYGRSLNFQAADAAALAGRPLVNKPGTTFAYDSGSLDLVADLLAEATATSAADYARRRLFAPMGIRDVLWPGSHGASGLQLRPRELLAFGQMYLDRGVWRGKRIVPASWVRSSTRAQIAVPPDQGIYSGYGYGWWVAPNSFAAHGYLGQVLVIFPRREEVIVVTSSREDGRTYHIVRRVARATRA
jgi:CubicO group peptidase (beta-lactamase class C family)